MNDLLKEIDVGRRSLRARRGMNRVQVRSSWMRNGRGGDDAAVYIRTAQMGKSSCNFRLPPTLWLAQLIGHRAGHIVTTPDFRASVEDAAASRCHRLRRRV